MQMSFAALCCLVLVLESAAFSTVMHQHKNHKGHKGHHHHHHHQHHHKGHHPDHHGHHGDHSNTNNAVSMAAPVGVSSVPSALVAGAMAHKQVSDGTLVTKMKELEQRLAKKQRAMKDGHLLVNGPLPADFSKRFAHAVSDATGCDAGKVVVMKSAPVSGQPGVIAVHFQAPPLIVTAVEEQSGEADSKLAKGSLRSFLVDKNDDDENEAPSKHQEHETPTPVEAKGLDIDTAMPYGELEPFGREDTAQELTEDSVSESDQMVDQLERAEVAEEKRAVFRALTRLRGAAITSFDGVARSQTGNIDEYNKIHQWRKTHPLHHLADEESDVSKWAFPDNADF